jgi:hypothetical protein
MVMAISAWALLTMGATPQLSLAVERVCNSGDVKVRAAIPITAIESPLARSTIVVDAIAQPEVNVGRAQPGLFLIKGLTNVGASAHLSVLALPDGDGCLQLSSVETKSTPINNAQRSAWEKFLGGYKTLSAADQKKVGARFKSSIGALAASAGGGVVACTVALGTGVLIWSCVASIVDLGVSLFSNYLNAVREVLLATGKITSVESDALRLTIASASVASGLFTAVASGKLNGQTLGSALVNLGNGLTVVNGVVAGVGVSEATEVGVTTGIDSAKKYLYVLEVLQQSH